MSGPKALESTPFFLDKSANYNTLRKAQYFEPEFG